MASEIGASYYLALSWASQFETFLVGGPIILVVAENPTSFYVVSSIVVSLYCMAIVLPIFVPKLYQRRRRLESVLVTMRAQTTLSARCSTGNLLLDDSADDDDDDQPSKKRGTMVYRPKSTQMLNDEIHQW